MYINFIVGCSLSIFDCDYIDVLSGRSVEVLYD